MCKTECHQQQKKAEVGCYKKNGQIFFCMWVSFGFSAAFLPVTQIICHCFARDCQGPDSSNEQGAAGPISKGHSYCLLFKREERCEPTLTKRGWRRFCWQQHSELWPFLLPHFSKQAGKASLLWFCRHCAECAWQGRCCCCNAAAFRPIHGITAECQSSSQLSF